MSEFQFKVTGLTEDDGTERKRGNRSPARVTGWALLGIAVLVLLGVGRIEITSPSSGTTTLDAQIAVSGRVTGAANEMITLSVNGSSQTLPSPGGFFDVQVSLSPGENIISASANGYSSDPITVVRRLQPVIRISSPAGNTATTQNQIEVTGVVENSAGGTVTFDVNGATTSVGVMGERFSATVPLAVGRNIIRALLADASASPAVVEVDRLVTGIAITSPPDGSTTEQETVTVTGTVDNSDVPAITLKLNESRKPIALHSGSFAADIVLRVGENRMQAFAGDAASNEITVTRTLPPVIITLSSPPSGSTQSAVAAVRGTIQNARRNDVAVNVNGSGRVVMVTGGSFAAEVPLEIGQNVIRASQDDAVSNEVMVNRLPVPTLIVIMAPKGGQTQRSSVRVLGTIANPRGQTVTLTVNDSARTLSAANGRFASDVALTIGDNRIRASQGDAVSNEVVVNRRALPTLIEITSPRSGQTRSSSVKVIGAVANPQGRSISLAINDSSRSADIINGGFALDVELAFGDNHIRASQGDAVSNEVVVTRLSAPTSIQIISPRSGRTREPSVRVTGSITNPHGPTITLRVNGFGRTLRIVNNGFASDVQLNEGDNRIRASQGDAVSNEVVVNRRALPTLIEITSPKSGQTRSPSVRVIGTVANPQGRSISLAINNSSRSAEIINGGFALDVELAVGDNHIRASQGDAVSNEVVVTRLSSPTSIRIISPKSGRTSDSSVRVTGLTTNPRGPTITLTVNGFSRTLRIVNNGFASDVQLNVGDNRIQASQGNAVSNEISLRRLPIGTSIKIISPRSGRVRESLVTVTGQVENAPGNTIRLTVNGISRNVQVTNGRFAADVRLVSGNNLIEASVAGASDRITLEHPNVPPDTPSDECSKINCDCRNVRASASLVHDWPRASVASAAKQPPVFLSSIRSEPQDRQAQCRAAEEMLRRRCKASGRVTGSCPPGASGPKAWPPGNRKRPSSLRLPKEGVNKP